MTPAEHDSPWSHAICIECWAGKYGNRQPVKLVDAEAVACCYCGKTTTDGIFTRDDPTTMPCLRG